MNETESVKGCTTDLRLFFLKLIKFTLCKHTNHFVSNVSALCNMRYNESISFRSGLSPNNNVISTPVQQFRHGSNQPMTCFTY